MTSMCSYCLKEIAGDFLSCEICLKTVHVSCLKILPDHGILLGDIFYDFTCVKCSTSQTEKFKRRKLQWVMVVIVTLHNLSVQSPGLSQNGHFHFSTHITSFIQKNWKNFFPNDKKKRKKKNILGTVAGILSLRTDVFVSGTEVIGSLGWWKLRKNCTPTEYEKFLQNQEKFSEDDEMQTKRIKLDLKLEDCCFDTEDELLKELEELKEDLVESCSVQREKIDVEVKTENLMENSIENCAENAEKTSKIISNIENKVKLETMTRDEEEKVCENLRIIIETEEIHKTEIPSWIRRYYRKLSVRKLKRKTEKIIQKTSENFKKDQIYLDRYFTNSQFHQNSLLAGSMSLDLFKSPFSNQILHPFIYRDTKVQPKFLKLMCELKFSVNKIPPERSSIDYCYAKPQHISAANSLLQQTFWPGIDMSESLSFPDFSVIALYKKLVIGCAFLVPDVSHNEAYISFLTVRPGWDRCGIGSFMLYHLTQTSHHKDITLHVSASNSAICLYQKFGFKSEELVLDFYDKFLPSNSPHSPHALLLRLTR